MQQATVLISITGAGPATSVGLHTFMQAARKVRKLAGFRRWQTFRVMDASDAILVVLDWESVKSMRQALATLQELTADADARGSYGVSLPEPLAFSFDRQLVPEEAVATLIRLTRPEATDELAARDSELALKALAAPGTTRIRGARSRRAGTTLCRIDFDTEDGIWHFLDSPLRQRWTAATGTDETWALNLPRLEFAGPASPSVHEPLRMLEDSLSVQLAVSDDGHSASIRLQGSVDRRSAELAERFCIGLVNDGCLRLDVDISGLRGISANVLLMLARTARALKDHGGIFTLVDNAERVRRITRGKQLEAALS
jgi:anti-anti-sigma regulatory factor